tara:strand:- start:5014 stop:6585 length:1572 start_codon:yes stop_codon:yes gene_type:complete
MALESTSILLQQQKALGEANKFVDYSKTIDETLGKAIEKEVDIRKKAEDKYSETMTAYEIEELKTSEYPEDWGPEMTAELARQKQEYAAAAQTVKTTRDKTSKEYIDAVAKMSELKTGMAGMRTKIGLWKENASEFAKLAEEGAITEGLSVNERNKLFGYNNSKNTKPVFKDGRFGVEYTWIDQDGNEKTDIAYEGEEPRVVPPATKEIEAVNAKYNDAVKLIGEGKWNESAWTQDIRNFTNTLNFDQLRSFAGDFESVNGSETFDDIEFVKTRQEKYQKENPNSEYGKWWQDPANKGELKEGITQFFKDTYLPKFREFERDQKSRQRINSAYRAFSVTGDEKSFNIVKTMQINDDVRRALSSTNVVNGKAGEIYSSQIRQVFDGAGLITDEGAPLEIGFISGRWNTAGKDYDGAQRSEVLEAIENSGNFTDDDMNSRPLAPGDQIVIYPSEIRTGDDEDMTADQRAKYAPRVITIPEGLKDKGRREIQNFLRQAYDQAFENMVLDDAYFDGTSERPDDNPLP